MVNSSTFLSCLILSGQSLALADVSASTTSINGNSLAAASSTSGSISGRVEHRQLSGQTTNQQTESPKQADQMIRHSLKNVSDSAHHLQNTIRDIVYEITRQQYVTPVEPNIIGSVVIPAMGPGTIAIGGYLPPRKKYMDLFAGHAQSLLTMLMEEGASLPDTSDNDSDLSAKLVKIRQVLDNLKAQNVLLQASMAGPSYENLVIGKQVVAMSDQLDDLKKLLKESEQRIGKDIKHDPE